MSYRVVKDAGGGVEAWSARRLPFEPTGRLLDFRRDLREACRTLVARPSEVLHAGYGSADRSLVDVENALLPSARRHGRTGRLARHWPW